MKEMRTYTSCMHTHVRYYVYEPKVILRIKGIIQIHHGMGEHADRYEHFASFLTNHGFVVVVSDFAGHGKSLIDFEQGYFGKAHGCEKLVFDMQRLVKIMRKTYPDIPYYMLGVDLGSLLIRKYMEKYCDYIESAVLLGTPDNCVKHKFIKKNYLRLLKQLKGPRYRSHVYFNMVQHSLNKQIGCSDSEVDWLTSDDKERKKFISDPMSHFTYTVQGYLDIMNLIDEVNSYEHIARIPKHIAIYLGSGEFDAMTKNNQVLANKYKTAKISDVTYHVFENRRHFILFEKNKREIYFSILDWLNERTYL